MAQKETEEAEEEEEEEEEEDEAEVQISCQAAAAKIHKLSQQWMPSSFANPETRGFLLCFGLLKY